MSDILEKFEQYISTNKEVLSVLPVNTKKNRAKYVEKVDEFIEEAEQINKSIWNTIQDRYDSILDVVENPKISELSKSIESIKDIELFNELNTPFEKLGFDKINHSLDCFFEGNLELVNKNIKLFLEKFRDYGIILTENDFHYSQYTNDYMKVFFEETSDGSLTSEKLKKTFETIYWKCPDIVIHIELNMRYLYNINSKKFEKELKERNDRTLRNMTLDKNSLLKITSNRFDIAEGTSSAKINCDLKNHKYNIWLGIKEVNSDIMATSLLNLSKEIQGKASGLIELNTDDSLKLNGRIQFRVYKGVIGKVGLIEYVMKVAALFRNPLTMVSPSTVSDLVNIPEGKFDQIDGDLILKDNIVMPMKIKSFAPQLSSYIVGTYNLENQDAALRIYTKFSNRKKGLYGLFRNLSLNSLANRIPLSSRNDSDYYEAEISQLPEIDADEKDCQIFLTKVDGDVEHNNFISSLKKIK